MKSKIAVATVSGKAYYLLVNELKRKNAIFLSLLPGESVPPEIKVVITTEKEKPKIHHGNVLVYSESSEPVAVVEEALRITQGKQDYEKIVVGVDPGERFGVAFFGDGKLVETFVCSSPNETAKTIAKLLERTPSETVTVKIGDGTPVFMRELVRLLDTQLSEQVALMAVSETGTSRTASGGVNRRGFTDVMSAIRIAGREGQTIPRRQTT